MYVVLTSDIVIYSWIIVKRKKVMRVVMTLFFIEYFHIVYLSISRFPCGDMQHFSFKLFYFPSFLTSEKLFYTKIFASGILLTIFS